MSKPIEVLLDRLRVEIAQDAFWPDLNRFDTDDWRVFADALLDTGDVRGELVELERRVRQTGDGRAELQLWRRSAAYAQVWREAIDPDEELDTRGYAGFLGVARVKDVELPAAARFIASPEGRLWSALRIEYNEPFEGYDADEEPAPRPARGLASLLPPRPGPDTHGPYLPIDDPAFAQIRGIDVSGVHMPFAKLAEAPFAGDLVALVCAVGRSTWSDFANGPWRPRVLRLVTRGWRKRGFAERGGWLPQWPANPAPALTQVQRLFVAHLDSDAAMGLAAHGSLARVEELEVRELRGAVDGLAALLVAPALPRLRRVVVSGFHAHDATPPRRWFVPDGAARIDAELRWSTSDGDSGKLGTTIARSGALTRLRSLLVRTRTPTDRGLRGLLAEPLPDLRSFGMAIRLLGAPTVRRLVEQMTGLERLNLGGLDDEGVQNLAEHRVGRGLTELRLWATFLPGGIEAIAHSPHLAGLRTLVLGGRGADGDDLARRLGASEGLRPETLAIFLGQGDEGWKAIVASSLLDSVRHLQLSVVGITETTLLRLLEAPGLAGLERLVIDGANGSFVEGAGRVLSRAGDVWPALKDIAGVPPTLWAQPRGSV